MKARLGARLIALAMFGAGGVAAGELDLSVYQGAGGEIRVNRDVDTVDPYFASKALSIFSAKHPVTLARAAWMFPK